MHLDSLGSPLKSPYTLQEPDLAQKARKEPLSPFQHPEPQKPRSDLESQKWPVWTKMAVSGPSAPKRPKSGLQAKILVNGPQRPERPKNRPNGPKKGPNVLDKPILTLFGPSLGPKQLDLAQMQLYAQLWAVEVSKLHF